MTTTELANTATATLSVGPVAAAVSSDAEDREDDERVLVKDAAEPRPLESAAALAIPVDDSSTRQVVRRDSSTFTRSPRKILMR